MNYYQHHIGDFNNATRHLTRIERSIYRDLIELYYDTEAPLTLDRAALCRKIIARTNEEATAVEQMLNEFFTETSTGWVHSRCEAEIVHMRANTTQKSAAGKASAAKRAANRHRSHDEQPTGVHHPLNGRDSNEQLPNTQYPIPNTQEIKAQAEPASPVQPQPEKAPQPQKFTEEDMQAAVWIFNALLKTFPTTKKPNLAKWADHVRLMREVDGKSHREVCNLFQFANRDSFWSSNILSPAKLREKWDQLEAKRTSAAQSGNNAAGRMSGVRDYTAGVNQDGSF